MRRTLMLDRPAPALPNAPADVSPTRRLWWIACAPCLWFRRRLMWKLALSHIAVVFIAFTGVFVLNLAVATGHLALPGYNIGHQVGKESIGRQTRAFALALSSENASEPALLSNQFRRFVTVAYVGNSSLSTGHILIVDRRGVLIDQVNSPLAIGAPVNDPEAPEMTQLVQNALAGETDLSSAKLYAFHASTGVYMGAYPIMDDKNRPVWACCCCARRGRNPSCGYCNAHCPASLAIRPPLP